MDTTLTDLHHSAFLQSRPLTQDSSSQQRSLKELGFGTYGDDLHNFFTVDRNYLVMTTAGKPVFALHGEIQSLAPMFATLYAIISKVETIKNPKPVEMVVEEVKSPSIE